MSAGTGTRASWTPPGSARCGPIATSATPGRPSATGTGTVCGASWRATVLSLDAYLRGDGATVIALGARRACVGAGGDMTPPTPVSALTSRALGERRASALRSLNSHKAPAYDEHVCACERASDEAVAPERSKQYRRRLLEDEQQRHSRLVLLQLAKQEIAPVLESCAVTPLSPGVVLDDIGEADPQCERGVVLPAFGRRQASPRSAGGSTRSPARDDLGSSDQPPRLPAQG